MTSIGTLTSTSSLTATAFRKPPARKDGTDPMAAVADKLGLSAEALKTELKSGKSLNDIATAQGVSHDDLITAIKAGLPTDATSGVDATDTAEKIAATKGMPPPPHGGGHGPGGPKGANTGINDSGKLDELSQLLDMDTDDVSDQASTATDLVKLLQSKGIDLTALHNVLDNGDLLDVSA